MTFREYIRQMDEENLCCMFCPFSRDESCIVDSENCPPAVRNLLDRDVEDPVFDDFFCR